MAGWIVVTVVPTNLAEHVAVAEADEAEGRSVDDEEGDDVSKAWCGGRFHGKAYAGLAVTADSHDRKGSHDQGEGPAEEENLGSLL